jgi:hypothetical protein
MGGFVKFWIAVLILAVAGVALGETAIYCVENLLPGG